MTQATVPGPSVERLTRRLLDTDRGDPFRDELVSWLVVSGRFRAFAEANRDKIRKKLRAARDLDSLADVRAELRTAHLLLSDRRIDLAFEAYGSGKGGPDFTVTFRASERFNPEVTRPRRLPD